MVRIKKRPFLIAVGILGILTAMLVFVSGCGKDENNTKKEDNSAENAVLYIDDDVVSVEEYEMLAKEYCNQIYMNYTTEQVNSKDFWEEEIDGVAPYTQLEDIVLDELKYNYALKQLAVELDVTDDYSYADVMASREEENDSRESASGEEASNGEISYGLNSFDEPTYYEYWYSNLETKVTNALIQEKIQVSEKDCRTYFDENEGAFSYDIGVSVLYAEIPYDSEEQRKTASETAQQFLHAMENTVSVDELADAFTEASIERLNLNSLDTQEGMSGIYTQRWEVASQLAEGEIYGPYEQNDAFCIIRCISRTENGVLDYESSKPQIERYLQQRAAQGIITRKEEGLDVKDGKISAKDIILSIGDEGN